MKKFILSAIIILAVAFQAEAQPKQSPQVQGNMEQNIDQDESNCRNVSVLKRQYIQDSLQLDAVQSTKFWAVYDKYEQKEQDIHDEFHKFKKEHMSPNGQARVQYKDLSNDQKVVFLEKKTRMKTELSNLEQELFLELKQILDPETLVRFYQLERNFRKEMVQKSRLERKENSGTIPTKRKR
jgi:hypothetical protein